MRNTHLSRTWLWLAALTALSACASKASTHAKDRAGNATAPTSQGQPATPPSSVPGIEQPPSTQLPGTANSAMASTPATATPGADEPCKAPCSAPPCMKSPTLLALGGAHSCALLDGKLACWGANHAGQLSLGRSTWPTPKAVPLPAGFKLAQMVLGDDFTCIRSQTGAVRCRFRQRSDRELARALNLGCKLVQGRLKCETTPKHAPVQQPMRDAWRLPQNWPTLDDTVSIAAGYSDLCALDRSGEVRCFSIGGPLPIFPPPWGKPVSGLSSVSQLAVGRVVACALSTSGEIACWDQNMVAKKIAGIRDAKAIAAGSFHIAILHADGHMSLWLQDPKALWGSPRLKRVEKVDNVVEIASGGLSTCARRRDGTVWCFGDLRSPQHDETISVPRELHPFERIQGVYGARRIAVGDGFACAEDARGVLCWGVRQFGRLGDGVMVEVTSPQRVELGTAAIDVSTSYRDSCAVTKDHRVKCWGANYGEPTSSTLRDIGGLDDAERVFMSRYTDCALRKGGQFSCWRASPKSPAVNETIPKLTDVVEASVARGRSCAVLRTGAVQCFRGALEPAKPIVGLRGVKEIASFNQGIVVLSATRPLITGLRPIFPTAQAKASISPIDGVGKALDVASAAETACALLPGGRRVTCQIELDIDNKPPARPYKRTYHLNGLQDAVSIEMDTEDDRHRPQLCFRSRTGQVGCFGDHRHGFLGDGRLQAAPQGQPAMVANLQDVVDLSVGYEHACALSRDGRISCWGDDRFGQVSGSARAYSVCPMRVHAP